MTQSHEELAELVALESRRLETYLRAIPTEAWSSSTACERWDVTTVVAHLAGAAEAFRLRIARGIAGDSSPEEGLPAPGHVNAETWSETNAERWIAARARLQSDALAELSARNAGLGELLESLSPGDWDAPCYHPGAVVPVRTLVGFRLLELCVHGWDVRLSLHPPAGLPEDCLPALIEFVMSYLRWFFSPGDSPATPVGYRFELSDGPSGAGIIVDGDQVGAAQPALDAADVTFFCRSETFVLLMCGRVALDAAISEGDLTFNGDAEKAAMFERWFHGA